MRIASVPAAATLAASDVDGSNVAGATIWISGNYQNGRKWLLRGCGGLGRGLDLGTILGTGEACNQGDKKNKRRRTGIHAAKYPLREDRKTR